MRGKWILFAGVTILLAVAAGALSVYRQNFGQKQAPAAPQTTVIPAAAPGSEISLQGLIQAQRVVAVAAPVDGVMETVDAEAGQDVFEGQLLAHIKNTKLDSALEAATAEQEQAKQRVTNLEATIIASRLEASRARADASRVKSDYDRLEKVYQRQQMLIKEGATPRLVFEKAEREYQEAKQELDTKDALARAAEDRLEGLSRDLDTAKKRLDDRATALDEAKGDIAAGDVRSPVDGTILSRRGAAGDEVNRTMEDLFRIAVTLSALEVEIQPQPDALPRIKVGQPASVFVAEVGGEPIAGTVREMKEGRVIIDFTSPSPAIKPGVTAQVKLKLQ
jgi:multidrug resistance efflux pump